MLLRSIFITIFAVIYALICPVLRKKYNSTSLYGIWIILMLCYIVPSVPLKYDNTAEIPVLSITANFIRGTEEYVANENIIGRLPTANLIDLSVVCTVVWAIVALYLTIKHIRSHYLFTSMLKKHSNFEFFTDDGIVVMSNPFIETPLLYGMVIPRIIIPDTVMNSAALPMIIEHETIHHKRQDLVVNFILIGISVVHWFNPFIPHLLRAMNTQCEMSCDSEVIKNKEKDMRYNYGEAIIRIASNDNNNHTHNSIAAFSNGKKYIKKRLINIIQNKQHKKKSKPLILMSIFILIFCVFLISSANSEKSVRFGTVTLEIPGYWTTEINQHGIMTIRCGPVIIGEICVTDGRNITYNDYFFNKLIIKNMHTNQMSVMTNQIISLENLTLKNEYKFIAEDSHNNCRYIIFLSSGFFSPHDANSLIDKIILHEQ